MIKQYTNGQAIPRIVNAEKWDQSYYETWPEHIKWGGDRPNGTGCYVVITKYGNTEIKNGDYLIYNDDGTLSVCDSFVFESIYKEL